jgi:broad specificity phosphatase PhoE
VPGIGFAAVVASDLRRALETARILADTLAVSEIAKLAALREQDEGAWTGMTKEQIKRRWPDRARERPRRPIGGEAPEAVLSRLLGVLAEIAGEYPECRVLAVTHNGVIHALERALGLPTLPVPLLEGRWLRVLAPRPRGGEWGLASLHAGELTAGRRARAGGASAAMMATR